MHGDFFLQTLADFEEEYSRRATEGNFDTVDVRFRIYDALWALAMALNDTMTMVNNSDIDETGCLALNGSMVPLEDFTYDNALMGCLIQWNLQRTNFSACNNYDFAVIVQYDFAVSAIWHILHLATT
jgi:hypothetical protein